MWFLSGYFVGVVLLVTWIVLMAVPGAIGDNRYGEDPLAKFHALFRPEPQAPVMREQSGSEASEADPGSGLQGEVEPTTETLGPDDTRGPARIVIADLERLDGLRRSGALTAEEFERLKKRVLDSSA